MDRENLLKSKTVDFRKIALNPDNPRIDIHNLDLNESINEYGLQQPIIIRPAEEADNGDIPKGCEYVVVDGDCRLDFMRQIPPKDPMLEAGKDVIIRDLTREEAFIVTIQANFLRKDFSIKEEVGLVQDLKKRGFSLRKIGKLVGKSHEWVRERQAIWKIKDDETIIKLYDGEITISEALGKSVRILTPAEEPTAPVKNEDWSVYFTKDQLGNFLAEDFKFYEQIVVTEDAALDSKKMRKVYCNSYDAKMQAIEWLVERGKVEPLLKAQYEIYTELKPDEIDNLIKTLEIHQQRVADVEEQKEAKPKEMFHRASKTKFLSLKNYGPFYSLILDYQEDKNPMYYLVKVANKENYHKLIDILTGFKAYLGLDENLKGVLKTYQHFDIVKIFPETDGHFRIDGVWSNSDDLKEFDQLLEQERAKLEPYEYVHKEEIQPEEDSTDLPITERPKPLAPLNPKTGFMTITKQEFTSLPKTVNALITEHKVQKDGSIMAYFYSWEDSNLLEKWLSHSRDWIDTRLDFPASTFNGTSLHDILISDKHLKELFPQLYESLKNLQKFTKNLKQISFSTINEIKLTANRLNIFAQELAEDLTILKSRRRTSGDGEKHLKICQQCLQPKWIKPSNNICDSCIVSNNHKEKAAAAASPGGGK